MTFRSSRRDFLKKASLAVGAVVLGACAPQAATQVAGEEPVAEQPTVEEAAAEQPTAEQVVEEAPSAEPVTVTALFHYLYENWDQRVAPYLEENPNVTFVTVDTQSDEEFVQKMTTMVAGGTPPDIAKVTGGRLIATADKGIYEDLKPHVDTSEVLSRVWSQLPDEGKEHRYCGQQVGLPFDIDSRLWYVNLDLYEKEGLTPPTNDWTWDDMVATGQSVTKPDENQWWASVPVTSFQDWSEWVWQAGGTVFTPDYAHVNLSEPESVAAAQFLVDLFNKYNICPSPSLNLGEIGVSFDSGKMAMFPGNSNALSLQLGDKTTWAFNWSAIFAPKGPGGDYGFVKSNAWSMLKDGKAKDAGWKFIEWWFDDEGHTHMASMGEMVARADIREAVSLKNIPDHLQATIARWADKGRGLERSPGWSTAQKIWKAEIETAITGGVPVEEAMENADKKAEADMAELMKDLCQ